MPIGVRCSQARAGGSPYPGSQLRGAYRASFGRPHPRMSSTLQPIVIPSPPLSSGFWDNVVPVQCPPVPVVPPSRAFVPRFLSHGPVVDTRPPAAPLRFRFPEPPDPRHWAPPQFLSASEAQPSAQEPSWPVAALSPSLPHASEAQPSVPVPAWPAATPSLAYEAPVPLFRAQPEAPSIVQLNPYSDTPDQGADGIENIPPLNGPPQLLDASVPPVTPEAPIGRLTTPYMCCDLCPSKIDPACPFEATSSRQVVDHWESAGHRNHFTTFANRGKSLNDGVVGQERVLSRLLAQMTPIRDSTDETGDKAIWDFQVDNQDGTVVDCEVAVETSFTEGLKTRNGFPVYQQVSTTRIAEDKGLHYDNEIYLEFHFNVSQPQSRDELEAQAVKGLTRNQKARLQRKAKKADNVRLGTCARIRVQQVGDPNPKVYCFDLPSQSHLKQQETTINIPLFAPHVGTDLCLIEVVIFTNNGIGGETAHFRYHAFYHDVTHPLLLAAADRISQIQQQPECAGFFPSVLPSNVEKEAEGGGRATLAKKHNTWTASCARRVGESIRMAQQQRKAGRKSAFRSTKDRLNYLLGSAPTHQSCGPACRCRKEPDVTRVPVDDLMDPYRKFQQDEFIFMCQRDLTLSKFAYDILNHFPLRGARVVSSGDYQVANNGANTPAEPVDGDGMEEDNPDGDLDPIAGPSVVLELPDDSLLELLEPEGVRIGAFVEEFSQLQAGQIPSKHYVLEVKCLSEDDGRIRLTALAPADLPDPDKLKTFTILPDTRVLAGALSLINLAHYEPPPPGSQAKRARRKLDADDLGMDALDESDDEDDSDSLTQQKKLAIRNQIWYWCERLWNQEPPPAIPAAGGRFPGLNPEQNAVTQAIAETDEPVYLLWGPPGTGKTTTLGAGVAHYVTEDGAKKAIVMAPTNTAADAVAKSIQAQLRDLGSESKMVRVYGSRYARDLIPEELEDHYYQWRRGTAANPTISAIDALRDAQVVVCTLDTATLRYATLYDACGVFDLAAFDEAGRIGIANAFVPLTLARRAIFCGDHKQMRPFLNQELQGLAHFHWDVSMLQLLIDLDHPWKQLVVNYRSVRQILRPSNRVLYSDNPLEAGMHEDRASEANGVIREHPWILKYFPTGPGLSVVPVKGEGSEMFGGSSFGNLAEAFYVATFIIKAWTSGLATADRKNVVGVVSFYRAQQDIINKLLEAYEVVNPDFHRGPWLAMMSAEKFQGLEADWVLITGCRGNVGDSYEKGDRDLGFLGQLERVNVGLTRARLGVAAFMRPPRYIRNRLWGEFIRAVAEYGSSSFSRLGSNDPLEALMCHANILDDQDHRKRYGGTPCPPDPEVENLYKLPPVYFEKEAAIMSSPAPQACTTLHLPAQRQGWA